MQTRATKKGQGQEDGQGLAISPNLYEVASSAPSNLKYLFWYIFWGKVKFKTILSTFLKSTTAFHEEKSFHSMFKIRIVKNLFQQKGLNMFALRTDKKYARDFLK